MEAAPQPQIFVRNQQGVVWGPLSPQTVELMIDSGILAGQILLSLDGLHFGYPERFPDVRDFIPRALWGDAAAASPVSSPEADADLPLIEMPLLEEAPQAPASAPASAAPMAGPGAMAAAQATRARPPPGAKPAAVGAARITRPEVPRAAAPPPAPQATVAPPVAATAPKPASPPAPTAPAVTGEGPPGQGDLSKVSPVRLYYLAASSEATGLLCFQLSDRVIDVHFRKGNPEYVASDHAEDGVGGFLLKQRLVTEAQLAKAEGEKARFGGELVGALFGLALLDPSTAFAQLTQRAQSLLLKALLAESGAFTFEPKELPSQKAMPLGNRWGILAETVRQFPMPELQRRLRDALDLPIMKSGGRISVADLRLSPRETRALSFIDGVRSLNQLGKDLPADNEQFLRVAFLLQHLDAVSFALVTPRPPPVAPQPAAPQPVSAQPSAPKPAAPAAKPAAAPKITAPPKPAAPPPPAAPPISPEAELPQLRAIAEKLRKQNHFEVLGLTEKADAAAVKVAYFKLAKVYHPDTVPPGVPAEYAKLKADIFGAANEANRRLSDDKSRAEYIEELKTGSEKVDVARIFAAEEMFQKACILVKARKFPEAVAMLDEAIKANADEGEFYAWRGYAKFFVAKERPRGLAEGLQDIQLALKKNERCAQAHYFHGSMAKLCGDTATATQEFKLTLTVQPDHVDAQRELRLLGTRK